jgi:uncharacterized protein (DUF433 family)
MNLVVEPADRIPLQEDAHGVIRVAGTRVTLDTIAEAFSEGATAEEIAQQYPSLALADVYSVIGYLLRHETDVAAYLKRRLEQCNAIQQENERRFNPQGVRARLLARGPHPVDVHK